MLNQILNKKKKSILKNKNIKMFLFFIFLSSLFWLLINLSKEYIGEAKFDVTYHNLSKAKVLQNTPSDQLQIELKTGGFKFLTYQFKRKKIKINLAHLRHLKKDTYFYLPNNHLRDFQIQFSQNVEVMSVVADTLFFKLTTNAIKTVKITPDFNIDFRTGYNLAKPISISADSVVIRGPKSWLDSIDEVKTEHLKLKKLAKNFEKKLSLKIRTNPKLNYSIRAVNVIITVDKFTETVLVTSFKIINLPAFYTITTIPKEVTVKYQVSLTNFNKVKASMFEIQCDFALSSRDSLSYLIPKLVKKPAFVNTVTIIPDRIEYLLKK